MDLISLALHKKTLGGGIRNALIIGIKECSAIHNELLAKLPTNGVIDCKKEDVEVNRRRLYNRIFSLFLY